MADNQESIASVAIELEAKLGKALEDGLKKVHGQMADVQDLVMKMGKAITDNLSSPIENTSKNAKSLADTAYNINKILEVTGTLSKLPEESYNNIVEHLKAAGELNEDLEKQWKAFIDGQKQAKKLSEDESKRKRQERILQEEFNVAIRKDIRDIDSLQKRAVEAQKERDKERFDLFKNLAIETGRTVADFFGLGDIYSKSLAIGKKVKDVLNKLFEPNKASNMLSERALKIKNLLQKTDKSSIPIEKLHTQNSIKNLKAEQQSFKNKKSSSKLEIKNLENQIKSGKLSKLQEDRAIQQYNRLLKAQRLKGGGKPPIPPSGTTGAAAGGGGEAIMMSRGAMAGMGAAAATVAVAVAAVAAVVLVLTKALSKASEVMEEFHTINFIAAGGQRKLAMAIADVTMQGPYLVKEVQESTRALAEAGFAMETLMANNNKLIADVTAYTRVTGVSVDITAKLIKTHRGLGGTMSQAREQLGTVAVAMQKFGLTTKDAESILTTMNDISSKLNVTFGYSPKQIVGATNAMAQLAGSAKRLGLDVAEASGFFKDLTDNAEKFIVATKGKSLFQGPTETLAMLVQDSDKILQNLQKFKPGVIRSQMMNQLYGMNDKQLRMIMDLKDQHTKWAEKEKQAAISRGESLEKLDLSEKNFLQASQQSKETMDNIDKLAKQSAENVGRQWDLAKAKVEAAFLKVGAVLMPIFVTAMDWIVGAFETVFGWFAKFFGRESIFGTTQSQFKEARDAANGLADAFKKAGASTEQIQHAEQRLANLQREKRLIEKDTSLDSKIKKEKLKDIEEQSQAMKEAIEEYGYDSSKSVDEYYKKAFEEIHKSAEEKDKRDANFRSKTESENKAMREKHNRERPKYPYGLESQREKPEPSPMKPSPDKEKISDLTKQQNLPTARGIDTKPVAEEVNKLTKEQEKQKEILNKIAENTYKTTSNFTDSVRWN